MTDRPRKPSDKEVNDLINWATTRRDFCASIRHDYTRYNHIILALMELRESRAALSPPGEEAAQIVEAATDIIPETVAKALAKRVRLGLRSLQTK